ncbi:Methylsterol monooxygenase [Seminavis robusta]|uniref:Methylsterol monooxygenase n=1 Tax=Seminavis robusta TaxID=568900 RepID=A0A9N8DYK2_9STRA|nr:Methylsterol monooxygenase [Seminavis robusta]|eukprot:Sro345_g122420.1 Methylsterol monooxygenase (287) ;mRNA; r:26797-28180
MSDGADNEVFAGPSWERLMTPENILGLAAYFAMLGFGFALVKRLADDGDNQISKKKLPVRGKHLDDFNKYDELYRRINKLLAGPFLLLGIHCAFYDPNMLWEVNDLSLKSVLFPMPLYFVIYDFFYATTHMTLHLKGIYAYVHKHHHRQQAPSRGSEDSINVHPIEFCLGHLNSIITLFLVCRVMQFHIVGSNILQLIYAATSCFNHSRHDITIAIGGLQLWTSKDHDVHHRIPNRNYGRVIMLWDWIFGTFRPYDDNDPVNPIAQLNPATGKSYEYEKLQQKKLT